MITSKVYNNKKIEDIKQNILKSLNYEFKDTELLVRALTHSSFKSESKFKVDFDNEKLEFIGDAVLDLIVSNFLLSHLKNSATEGTLSINRARIVNEKSLFLFAKKIELGKLLFISKSGIKMSIFNNPSVLADSFESLIGAIFLDSDYDTTERIVMGKYLEDFLKILDKSQKNYKGIINELISRNSLEMPIYEVVSIIGPDHDRIFKTKINIENRYISFGKGKSIKESQQEAAKNCLSLLKEEYYD